LKTRRFQFKGLPASASVPVSVHSAGCSDNSHAKTQGVRPSLGRVARETNSSDLLHLLSMSTTAKGDAFEERVFAQLQGELAKGALGLIPECCRIFRKKGYHSRDRNSPIEFDVSIEVFRPGADAFSLLWLWECKDYAGAVPVDDVEEFWAKVQQVAGVNVKAGFAASGELSRGAISFARSKGMAVIRVRTEYIEEIDWTIGLTRSFDPAPKRKKLQPVNVLTLDLGADTYDCWEDFVRALLQPS
jgi:hypothetical protein